jgi:hypothetical protein
MSEDYTPRRAKLRLTNIGVSPVGEGRLVILADDELRGPVEITLEADDARWLRASFADLTRVLYWPDLADAE